MAHVDALDTVDQKEEKAEAVTPPTNAMIKRQLGAVMGVLVADAGSMPLHWVQCSLNHFCPLSRAQLHIIVTNALSAGVQGSSYGQSHLSKDE